MQYDKSKYKIQTWKTIANLHWIINPGLAINELLLGQRVAKITLIEKDDSKSLPERTKIPCPHCGTIHPAKKWLPPNNSFKNWFGLYCDDCGKTIPCLTNLTSMILLVLTFPIWIWFKNRWKKQWLAKQPARYQNINYDFDPNPFAGYGWVSQGLAWGLVMYILMAIMFPIFIGDGLTLKHALISIPLWGIGGLAFGYTLKLINNRSGMKPQPN